MTTTLHTMTTTPTEIGRLAAEGITDLLRRATAGAPVSTYAESEPPVSWSALASGGWDTVGMLDGGEGATLRDLAEIARAWGRACLPQPLLVTVLSKRLSAAAAGHDGPVTFALQASATSSEGVYVPFGQVPGIVVATGLGSGTDGLAPAPEGEPDPLGLTLRGLETAGPLTELSATAAREIAVVLAAEATGGAERLIADSLAFVAERQQFGKPIGSFQAVKHHLADMAIAAETAETAVIWAAERPEDAFRGAAFALGQCLDLAERAIQVHGGLGFTWEMGLHFPLRTMLLVRELVEALEAHHG